MEDENRSIATARVDLPLELLLLSVFFYTLSSQLACLPGPGIRILRGKVWGNSFFQKFFHFFFFLS